MNNMYYSKNKLLSYNRFISVVVGGRGIGKTYSFKLHALNNEKSCIWIRRYAEDIKDENGLGERFLADLPEEYKENFFYFSGGIYQSEDKIATKKEGVYKPKTNAIPKVLFVALSTSRRLKSQSWNDYNLIIFDEFLEPKGGRYLTNEYSTFLDLLETVSRLRTDVKVILSANATSALNPYFTEWKITSPENGTGFKKVGKDIIIEWVKPSKEFTDYKINTPLGRLSQNTTWSKMSVLNLTPEDELYGVDEKPITARYNYSIKLLEHGNFGCYWNDGNLYITRAYDSSFNFVISDTPSGVPMQYYAKTFRDAYISGKLHFDSVSTKYAILNWKPKG